MLKRLLSKILPDFNKRELNRLQKVAAAAGKLEPTMQALSDSELKAITTHLRDQFKASATMESLIPEAFAAVREASRRTLNMRHFDVQFLGGLVLHEGKIAEMKTGEGKTLVAPLAVYLQAIQGKSTHIVTVNDYLAKRDAHWMGKIYEALDLKVAYIIHDLSPAERKESYQADVIYATNNELGFDYLRDNMAVSPEQIVQGPLEFAIVDEVDSILIDEARTPLIISAPAEESTQKYYQYAQLIPTLAENVDYDIDYQTRTCNLTEEGIAKLEKSLGVENIYTEVGLTEVHHIEQALKAHALFKKDVDYVVKDGQVIIVDEFTGRLMPGRRYSAGLHQALEAKEDAEVQRESRTLATITFQNFFRLYEKLAGMTGTAVTEAEEFHSIYKLDTIVAPTNKPMIRTDAADKVYKSETAKFQAVVEDITARHQNGQPVLVGTISIEKSETLSGLLNHAKIPHQVLNAKFHEKEAAIVAQAGRLSAVTIATNMAGRGTDIILGGNPEFLAKNQTDGTDEGEEYTKALAHFRTVCAQEQQAVIAAGGLHVLGTERHESRRIDNQLRGRSGRQGDPGSSQFYISLGDNLMKMFGSERIISLMDRLKLPDDLPIENKLVSHSIESAQRRIEAHNFDIRKHVLEYDEILNKHRHIIYGRRRRFLAADDRQLIKEFNQALTDELTFLVQRHSDKYGTVDSQQLFEALAAISQEFNPHDFASGALQNEAVTPELIKHFQQITQEKLADLEEPLRTNLLRQILLRTTDILWMEHLDNMTRLREGVSLHGYGQRDPLISYKQEAYTMFERLLANIRSDAIRTFFKMQLAPLTAQPVATTQPVVVTPSVHGGTTNEEAINQGLQSFDASQPTSTDDSPAAQASQVFVTSESPISKPSGPGRNDPCPCGSGKKHKKCCGK